MPKSKARRSQTDKYRFDQEPQHFTHRLQKVPFGSAAELLRHCDSQWFAYLERLISNPAEPNPLEQYQCADLRNGLKARGYIGLTRRQLLAKRDLYWDRLKAGEPSYSDTELYDTSYFLKD